MTAFQLCPHVRYQPLPASGFYWLLVASEYCPPVWVWAPVAARVDDIKAGPFKSSLIGISFGR